MAASAILVGVLAAIDTGLLGEPALLLSLTPLAFLLAAALVRLTTVRGLGDDVLYHHADVLRGPLSPLRLDGPEERGLHGERARDLLVRDLRAALGRTRDSAPAIRHRRVPDPIRPVGLLRPSEPSRVGRATRLSGTLRTDVEILEVASKVDPPQLADAV